MALDVALSGSTRQRWNDEERRQREPSVVDADSSLVVKGLSQFLCHPVTGALPILSPILVYLRVNSASVQQQCRRHLLESEGHQELFTWARTQLLRFLTMPTNV